jgi:predicted short-subunit dehydrogenase-like oxidoreductase (DUF2520 family)
MKSLNIIGAGRVGRTLASLCEEKHTFAVQDVLDRTEAGARAAVAFIGDGVPVADIEKLRHADIWMLTPPDRQIRTLAEAVARAGLLRAGDIVFHCSGSMSSGELEVASAAGALVASVHPLKTFAEPRDAVRTFAGTYCAAEGDDGALQVLQPAFERIGGNVSLIDARSKVVYHAASVIVCNYLAALVETGLRCFEKAGIPRDAASAMTQPILRETLDNVIQLGPAHALTGPIARGDAAVVARHLQALDAWDTTAARIYRSLGAAAVELARRHGEADAEALREIEVLLTR